MPTKDTTLNLITLFLSHCLSIIGIGDFFLFCFPKGAFTLKIHSSKKREKEKLFELKCQEKDIIIPFWICRITFRDDLALNVERKAKIGYRLWSWIKNWDREGQLALETEREKVLLFYIQGTVLVLYISE